MKDDNAGFYSARTIDDCSVLVNPKQQDVYWTQLPRKDGTVKIATITALFIEILDRLDQIEKKLEGK